MWQWPISMSYLSWMRLPLGLQGPGKSSRAFPWETAALEYFALAIFTVPPLSISDVVVQGETVPAYTFWFHCFSSLWLFFFPVHFSIWLVKLLLFLYQGRLRTLLIKLPGFLFQWHPSFECVSVLLNQLCIETLEGSTTLLFELHIWFNPLVLFCLFIWLLL